MWALIRSHDPLSYTPDHMIIIIHIRSHNHYHTQSHDHNNSPIPLPLTSWLPLTTVLFVSMVTPNNKQSLLV